MDMEMLMIVLALAGVLLVLQVGPGTLAALVRPVQKKLCGDKRKQSRNIREEDDDTTKAVIRHRKTGRIALYQMSIRTLEKGQRVARPWHKLTLPELQEGEYLLISGDRSSDDPHAVGEVYLKHRETTGTVSRGHLIYGKDEDGYYIEDNNSRNGVYLEETGEQVSSSKALEQVLEKLVMLGDEPVVFAREDEKKAAAVKLEMNVTEDEASSKTRPHMGRRRGER